MVHKAVAGVLFASLFVAGVSAAADMRMRQNFEIPAQSLDSALLAFSDQTKVQVLMWASGGPKLRSSGVKGELSAEDALKSILENTGLAYRQIDAETVAIVESAAMTQSPQLRLTRINSDSQAEPNKQDSSAQERGGEGSQEVVVIGKPTENVDMRRSVDDALPFQVITREEIQRDGFLNVTQFVRSFTANSTAPNFEAGAAMGSNQGGKVEINLRGLGISNTLILVNGRRMAANMPYSAQGDVGTIPLSAIERVEMLSSGASAIYGSSAVGGVVNFILRKDYSGVEVDATYGNLLDSDAAARKFSFVAGYNTSEQRNNFTVYGDWSDQNLMLLGDRGLAGRLRERILAVRPGLLLNSATPPAGARGNIRSASGAPLGIPSNPSAIYASVPAGYNGTGGLAAFNSTAGVYNLSTQYIGEGGDYRTLLDAAESMTLGLNTYHRVSTGFNLFTELSYSEREHSGPFASQYRRSFTVPASNAFNPFGQTVVVTSVAGDTGPVSFKSRFEDYRAVGGAEGQFSERWRYVADVAYQHSSLPSVYKNLPMGQFFNPAILTSSDPAVAYNPFLDYDAASNTQAAINAITTDNLGNYDHYLVQSAFRVFGDFNLFSRRIELASGAEHRKEKFYDATASYVRVSDGALVYFAENSGSGDMSRNVVSAYAEVKVPLLGSRAGGQRLDLDVAVRSEDFSDFGMTTNPLVALRYQPNSAIALRGSWGTGFVAPALVDVDYNTYTPTSASTVTDPKRGNEQVSVVPTGLLNRYIEPETAESISFGIVFTPQFAPGLRLNADWFSVSKKDNIRYQSVQTIVNNEDYLPHLVVRGAPSGGYSVGPIVSAFSGMLNATKAEVQAIDLGANYVFDTGIGQFTLHGNSTVMTRYEIQIATNGPLVDYINRPLDLTNSPVRFRGNAGVGFNRGPLGLHLNVHHIGSYNARTGYLDVQGSDKIDSSNDVGMQFSYDFNGMAASRGGWLSGVKMLVGIENIFDEDPPFVAGLPDTLGYSEFSPTRGTNYYVTLRKSFNP